MFGPLCASPCRVQVRVVNVAPEVMGKSRWAARGSAFFFAHFHLPDASLAFLVHLYLMNNPKQLLKLREIAQPVCEAHGLTLVDARFSNEGGMVLKVLIERPGSDPDTGSGVTLTDCQEVSRDLSNTLDAHEDAMPKGGYRLEVGSPGLERPLFGLEDYSRFAGREIRLQAIRPIDGQRRFTGVLQGIEDDVVVLEQDGTPIRVSHRDIVKANLVYRF